MRGLVLDIEQGNFLKLAKDGTILRYVLCIIKMQYCFQSVF